MASSAVAGPLSPSKASNGSTNGVMSSTLATQLAEFVLMHRWEDLPQEVRHEAKRALLNWLGCAIGGSQHENIAVAEKALLPVGGEPRATIVGRRRRTDVLTATLLNCTSSGVHSFDDTHAEIILHPTGPIAAPLLAMSESNKVSGRDFLTALVLGIEIESRLSRAIAVSPANCHVGWYLTGLTGGVGAAAATAKMLKLSATATTWAIGIASGQGAGNRAMHAAMTSAMVPAHAGQCGLRAALMAQAGFTCGANSLENPNGFLSLFAEKADPNSLTDGLGERYEIMANTHKPWPCGIVIHPVVDACLQIRHQTKLRPEDIQSVEVHVHPTTITLTNRRHPANDFKSVVSLFHWTAGPLATGRGDIGINTDKIVQDPAIKALRDRVHAISEPSLMPDAARVTVKTAHGTWTKSIEHCLGSVSKPMSDRDLERKFLGLCNQILEPQSAERLIAACWKIDETQDAGSIANIAA